MQKTCQRCYQLQIYGSYALLIPDLLFGCVYFCWNIFNPNLAVNTSWFWSALKHTVIAYNRPTALPEIDIFLRISRSYLETISKTPNHLCKAFKNSAFGLWSILYLLSVHVFDVMKFSVWQRSSIRISM